MCAALLIYLQQSNPLKKLRLMGMCRLRTGELVMHTPFNHAGGGLAQRHQLRMLPHDHTTIYVLAWNVFTLYTYPLNASSMHADQQPSPSPKQTQWDYLPFASCFSGMSHLRLFHSGTAILESAPQQQERCRL